MLPCRLQALSLGISKNQKRGRRIQDLSDNFSHDVYHIRMSSTEHVVEVNDIRFERSVLESPIPVWVTYGASWCPPCRAFQPVHEAVAAQFEGRVASFHVDIDEAPEATSNAKVKSVPTHVCYKDGVEVRRLLGALSKAQVETAYGSLL